MGIIGLIGSAALALSLAAAGFGTAALAHGQDESHAEPSRHGHGEGMRPGAIPRSLREMIEMHRGHAHKHHFEAMQDMTQEQFEAVVGAMRELGLVLPPMDSERGHRLFVEKGCIACHSVNGVGGRLGPPLNEADMPAPMNAFEFAARMWRGAEAMVALQDELLGGVIELDGQELADIIAFAHDEHEQAELTADEIPERLRRIIDAAR